MASIAADDQTFASGRYSKRKRTQITYCMDEMDVSDSESDLEHVQAKKYKPSTNSRPLPKRKIFPFLELPAEIRNMIYGHTLTDPSGIQFEAIIKHKRRIVQRTGETDEFINEDGEVEDRGPRLLLPALLAVNKQIHAEALDILYGNEFIFSDSNALYNFMISLSPAAAKHLKHLRLKSWGFSRYSKIYNHACFAVLVGATNIQKLCIDSIRGYSNAPKHIAANIYRDTYMWMEAVGAAQGKVDAAVDIIHLDENQFDRYRWGSSSNPPNLTQAEKLEMYQTELRKLLVSQQNRIMGRPTKKPKKKTAKDDL